MVTYDPTPDFALRVARTCPDGAPIPYTVREANQSADHAKWEEARQSELASLRENNVFHLVPRPTDVPVIPSQWVHDIKLNEHNQIDCYKARLVAKGYVQVEGVHYTETYAPTAKFVSIRVVIALAAMFGWLLHQMDVTTAFLYADIDGDIFLEQPDGHVDKTFPKHVWKLKKALYGLKQSPHLWNLVMDKFLKAHGFTPSFADPCVYIKIEAWHITIIVLYVDDLIIATSTTKALNDIKTKLHQRFKMKDLGELRYCLGIQIRHNTDTIQMGQQNYISDILKRFDMTECNGVSTPMDRPLLSAPIIPTKPCNLPYRELVGSLQYLSVATRPAITNAVSQLSRHLSNFDGSHYTAAKRVLRYLKSTQDLALTYHRGSNVHGHFSQTLYNGPSPDQVKDRKITCYSYADFGGTKMDRRSTTEYVNLFAGAAISWKSQLQPTVALSTLEAEYMAMSKEAQEVIWLR
jgi:hypothetical protein